MQFALHDLMAITQGNAQENVIRSDLTSAGTRNL